MLGDHAPVATVAVSDLQRAKTFYEKTLGLVQTSAEGDEAVSYGTLASKLLVYRSQFARTNKATAVTWLVGDEIERLVKELEAKGVAFEDYDMPGMPRRGHIHGGGGHGPRAAWFKDPDGNIHGLVDR